MVLLCQMRWWLLEEQEQLHQKRRQSGTTKPWYLEASPLFTHRHCNRELTITVGWCLPVA
jgi:hypothetical protein